MSPSPVGWLLVLKPLGRWGWMPPMGLTIQVGPCEHQAGKSRRDRVVKLEPPTYPPRVTPNSPGAAGDRFGWGVTYWPWLMVNSNGSWGDGGGLGAWSCRDGDEAMPAPTFLPAPCCPSGLTWVTQGACSPWETSGMGWPTTGKPCVGIVDEDREGTWGRAMGWGPAHHRAQAAWHLPAEPVASLGAHRQCRECLAALPEDGDVGGTHVSPAPHPSPVRWGGRGGSPRHPLPSPHLHGCAQRAGNPLQ